MINSEQRRGHMARNIAHGGPLRGGGGSPATRRSFLKTAGAAGLGAVAGSGALGLAAPSVRAAPATVVSWASAGQRWEFPQKGVYPLFQKKFPDIKVQIVAEPIADMLPKTAVAMASKSDRYDVIHEDYNFVPQFIAQHALHPIQPSPPNHPASKKDILADIPEDVLDLYPDKPA